MTKNEVLKQVYDLSVNGNFNHEEKWSFNQFKKYVTEKSKKYVTEKSNSGKQTVLMEIELPDGWWTLFIMKIRDGFWDYYIPETRERDNEIREELGIKT